MKQLQNNFTTPEQSKRLLELGVPIDTADMFRIREDTLPIVKVGFESNVELPCWSVGRLMEIYYISRGAYSIEYYYHNNTNMIDYMIRRFEIQKGKLDFSKLEK